MRALQIGEHRAYLRYVMEDATGEEVVHLIDAISTNVTSFFREPAHFDYVKERVREWLVGGQHRFRFWSAASSTGEEPYTLAISIHEALAGAGADVKILATDISTQVLRKCEEGCYSLDKLENVPKCLRDRYFELQRESGETHCVVKPALRKMVVFRRLNLSQPPFPMRGPFDMVFCRNVMIYFDNAIRGRLLAEIHRLLRPGGYLLVGHAESLTGMLGPFTMVQPSVYRKAG
jgi:chemotaxis protein methyltransferase CheR